MEITCGQCGFKTEVPDHYIDQAWTPRIDQGLLKIGGCQNLKSEAFRRSRGQCPGLQAAIFKEGLRRLRALMNKHNAVLRSHGVDVDYWRGRSSKRGTAGRPK